MCNHLLMTSFVTGRTVLRLVPPLFRRIEVFSPDLLDINDRWRCSTLNARYIKQTVTDCFKVAQAIALQFSQHNNIIIILYSNHGNLAVSAGDLSHSWPVPDFLSVFPYGTFQVCFFLATLAWLTVVIIFTCILYNCFVFA